MLAESTESMGHSSNPAQMSVVECTVAQMYKTVYRAEQQRSYAAIMLGFTFCKLVWHALKSGYVQGSGFW